MSVELIRPDPNVGNRETYTLTGLNILIAIINKIVSKTPIDPSDTLVAVNANKIVVSHPPDSRKFWFNISIGARGRSNAKEVADATQVVCSILGGNAPKLFSLADPEVENKLFEHINQVLVRRAKKAQAK